MEAFPKCKVLQDLKNIYIHVVVDGVLSQRTHLPCGRGVFKYKEKKKPCQTLWQWQACMHPSLNIISTCSLGMVCACEG